jgi:hypothetical protein
MQKEKDPKWVNSQTPNKDLLPPCCQMSQNFIFIAFEIWLFELTLQKQKHKQKQKSILPTLI